MVFFFFFEVKERHLKMKTVVLGCHIRSCCGICVDVNVCVFV